MRGRRARQGEQLGSLRYGLGGGDFARAGLTPEAAWPVRGRRARQGERLGSATCEGTLRVVFHVLETSTENRFVRGTALWEKNALCGETLRVAFHIQ